MDREDSFEELWDVIQSDGDEDSAQGVVDGLDAWAVADTLAEIGALDFTDRGDDTEPITDFIQDIVDGVQAIIG